MQSIVVIAMLAFSLFGSGWSSEHKSFWEWKLGHPLEGYQEHRLARGEWNPYGPSQSLDKSCLSNKDIFPCGGLQGLSCSKGYRCLYNDHSFATHPDQLGICVPITPK